MNFVEDFGEILLGRQGIMYIHLHVHFVPMLDSTNGKGLTILHPWDGIFISRAD